MRVLFLKTALFISAAALLSWGIVAHAECPAGTYWESWAFGPAACSPYCAPIPGYNDGTKPAPSELCTHEGCQPVQYSWLGNLVIAESRLSNGYPVMGWAGPCQELSHDLCPYIYVRAFNDLSTNAERAQRAQRHE